MEKFSLEKIGEFSVTDRDLEQVIEDMGIKESEIDAFPQNGRVLNIGGGRYKKFEEELRQKRNDLQIVSIDPTLGIDPDKDLATGEWYMEKIGPTIFYKQKERPRSQRLGKDAVIDKPEEFQKQRLEKIKNSDSNSVAALAPEFPFKPGSFDVIMDCVSSMRYLDDEETRKENLRSICELLNPGGSAYITSLRKNELELINDDTFQVALLREYQGRDTEGCDVKITKKK